MKKSIILFTLLIVISFKTYSQEKINPNWVLFSSSVIFNIKNAKLNVSGTFRELMATIKFDPAKTDNIIEGKVFTNTIKTGIDMRDSHLRKAEYFNVEKFPEISLKTNSITKVKDDKYLAKCTITIKGKTKEIDFPFTFTEKGNQGTFSGSIILNRLDFGVGTSSIVMSNNVEIKINISALKK